MLGDSDGRGSETWHTAFASPRCSPVPRLRRALGVVFLLLTVHHLPSPKPVAALPGVRDASAQSASQLCAHVDKEAPSAVASSGFACGRNQRWRAARRAVQEEAGQVEGSLRERGMPRFDCAQVGFVGRCRNVLQRACAQLLSQERALPQRHCSSLPGHKVRLRSTAAAASPQQKP